MQNIQFLHQGISAIANVTLMVCDTFAQAGRPENEVRKIYHWVLLRYTLTICACQVVRRSPEHAFQP